MNDFKHQVKQLLNEIELEMQRIALWQSLPPPAEAFLSEQPFAIDTMQSHQWLQWIFLPRMRAVIETSNDIPRNFALYPYFEESLKEADNASNLLRLIKTLDQLVKD